jgi:hypothetical protein
MLLLWDSYWHAWASQPQAESQGIIPRGRSESNHQEVKKYLNKNFNFSFEYPGSWTLSQGLDGNGVSIFPDQKSASAYLRRVIGVGGSVGQPSEKDSGRLQTLDEDFDSLLSAINQGPYPAHNLIVLSRKRTTIQGLPALVSRIEYETGNPRQHWVYIYILIHTPDDATTYHISLYCHPDDLSVFSRSFDLVVRTFRILGPRA